MKPRDVPYLETLLESLGGGVGAAIGAAGGLLIGTAAGPLILVGGAVGAVAGLAIARNETLHGTVDELKDYLRVCALLKKKFAADLYQASLLDSGAAAQALSNGIEILCRARIVRPNSGDQRIPKDELWDFPGRLLTAEELRPDLDVLAKRGEITVTCSAISVASACTLRSLVARFSDSYGLRLIIDGSYCNGREQMRVLAQRRECDFMIVSNDPFFLTDHSHTSAYRLLGPVNGETQYLFRKKTIYGSRYNRLLTYAASSAELHYRAGIGIPKTVKPELIEDAREIPRRVEDLSGGDYVIAWEPLADAISSSRLFEVVPGTKHCVQFSLFCHKSWRKPSMARSRMAFKRLFQNEWRLCAENPTAALDRLRFDSQFMADFAVGCGLLLPNTRLVTLVRWIQQNVYSRQQLTRL